MSVVPAVGGYCSHLLTLYVILPLKESSDVSLYGAVCPSRLLQIACVRDRVNPSIFCFSQGHVWLKFSCRVDVVPTVNLGLHGKP